ncbi:MAG: hypothetical protein IPK19_32245 [Chloroflexi bacterium]|nr:hypothetical protein [Chloroflexota bacterium]
MARWIFSTITLFLLALGACATPAASPAPAQPPATQAATAMPSGGQSLPTGLPTATPLLRATLPPEWTPTPSVTPLESPTPMPQGTPVPTFDMANAVLLTSPTREACAGFTIQYDQTAMTFNRRENPRVTWTVVPNALAYRVALFDEARNTVFATIVGETTTDFGSHLFVGQARYFWEVRPFDNAGTQLCAAIGALLIPIN